MYQDFDIYTIIKLFMNNLYVKVTLLFSRLFTATSILMKPEFANCLKMLKVWVSMFKKGKYEGCSINSWKMFIKLFWLTRIYLFFANDTGKYVCERYCKCQINMLILKKVTHVLLTYGNKHCRALNEK